MTADCPSDSDLRRVIDGTISSEKGAEVESHLDACNRCRLRLDELAGVAAVTGVLKQAVAVKQADSPALRTVIARLAARNSSSTISLVGPRSDELPRLGPASRPGYLGSLNGIDLRRIIGRGGMGVVYEGHDPVLDRTVAVKVLAPHLAGDAEAKERFLREARAAAAITHENVVSIHAIDHFGELPYLVLQHIRGESLAEVLSRETRLPVDRAAAIGAAVARVGGGSRERLDSPRHQAGECPHRERHRCRAADGLRPGEGHRWCRHHECRCGRGNGRVHVARAGFGASTRRPLGPVQPGHLALRRCRGAGAVRRRFAVRRTKQDLPRRTTAARFLCSGVVSEGRVSATGERPEAALCEHGEVAAALEYKAEAAHQTETTTSPRRRWKWVAGAGVVAAIVIALAVTQPWSPRDRGDQTGATGKNPTTPPIPAQTPLPFAIVGRAERHETLAAAIDAAGAGEIIEVSGDGPYRSPRVDVRGRTLTIRAAAGSRPRFVPGETVEAASPQWLNIDGELTLEGVTVDWSTVDRPGLDDNADPAVIAVSGRLSLTRCAVFSGKRVGCIGCNGPLTVDRCHLVSSTASGECVLWESTGQLVLTHTTLEGRYGVVTTAELGGNRSAMFTHCTFLTDVAVVVRVRQATTTPIPVTAQKCVFDSPQIVMPFFLPTYPKNGAPPTFAELRTTARKVLAWTDRENVYRLKVNYLATRAADKPQHSGDLTELGDWLKFWGPSAGTAIAGEIRFTARPNGRMSTLPKIESITKTTGQVPADVGASAAPG